MPKSRATQQEHVNDAPAQQQGPVNLNNLGQDPQNTMGNCCKTTRIRLPRPVNWTTVAVSFI